MAARVPFADRFTFFLLTEPRLFERPDGLRILLLRPWFEAALSHGLAVGLGYDGLLFLTPTKRQEHRLWQQVSYNHRWKPIGALLRFRLEERFFSDAKRISVRGRFFTGIAVPIVREVELLVSNELFVSFNEVPDLDPRGVSENRAFVGFGWRITKWATTSLGYQMQWLKAPDLINHTVLAGFVFTAQRRSP